MDVVGVLGHAQSLGRSVHPGQVLPHPAGEVLVGDGLPLPEDPGGQEHGVLDLLVAGAAADIVAQGEADLLPAGVRAGVDQALGAHDHTGGAEAALDRAAVGEGIGVHVLLPLGEALAGDDAPALHF